MIGEFLRRLGYYLRRGQFEAELDEEMRHHLAMKERDSAASPAPKQFGNVTLLKEDSRAMWAWTFWEQLLQDLRYAIRTMNANRAFTALTALSLALGIGAKTAIYSFMDSILLRSLPVFDPESLVVFNWHAKDTRGDFVMHGGDGHIWDDESGQSSGIFPFPAFELFQKNVSDFVNVFGYCPPYPALNLIAKGQAEVVNGEYVSGEYFRGLAVSPAAGRLLMPDDDRAAAPPVVVLSHAFSQRRFGVAANATGQTILVNNTPFTVVGVAPPEFFGVDPAAAPDVYLPMRASDLPAQQYLGQNYYWVEIMGRLRPGVSRAQAQAALAPQFLRWVAGTATNDQERANLPALVLKEGATGLKSLRRMYSKPLLVLFALVGLILALACANVANLLLARAAARKREMALRLSIGAGRFRLVRQLLTEGVLLALLGGALGVLVAIWGIRFLTLMLANGQVDFTLHAQLNWRVLGAAAALSIITGVLFGLAPALQSTRVEVMPVLKETCAGQMGARHSFWRISLSQVLVAGQIAISMLMLVAAGLFVKTLSNLQSVDLGFNRENVLLFELNAAQAGHKNPEICTFYDGLRKRLSEIPGVRNVTLSNRFLIRAAFHLPIRIHGAEPTGDYNVLAIGPAFFNTMRIPILAGREIVESDRPGSQPLL